MSRSFAGFWESMVQPDGSQSAVDVIGKLCDVIEAHPGDDIVKVAILLWLTTLCTLIRLICRHF